MWKLLAGVAAWTALGGSGALQTAQTAEQNLTPAQLRADLEVMVDTLRRRHPGVYHFVPRERFDQAVAEVSGRLDRMNADEAFVAFDRIAARVGDAHTYLEVPVQSPRVPLQIVRVDDEFRIAAVLPGYERALGTRVIAIESTPIARAFDMAVDLTPHHETMPLRHAWATGFLHWGLILRGLGIAPSRNEVTLTVRADDGSESRLRLTLSPLATHRGWITVAQTTPLSRTRPDEGFWCSFLREARTVYCNFRSYENLRSNSRQLFDLISRERPAKVVIDLRQNNGGDYHVGRRHILNPLRAMPSINQRGRLFVLVGPLTFSAAMANAAQFRAETNATLVGQPIGSRPNSFSEVDDRPLPNSRWSLHYSTRYYQFQPGDPDNVVRPHVEVRPTWETVRAGRDLALEWVLAQPIQP